MHSINPSYVAHPDATALPLSQLAAVECGTHFDDPRLNRTETGMALLPDTIRREIRRRARTPHHRNDVLRQRLGRGDSQRRLGPKTQGPVARIRRRRPTPACPSLFGLGHPAQGDGFGFPTCAWAGWSAGSALPPRSSSEKSCEGGRHLASAPPEGTLRLSAVRRGQEATGRGRSGQAASSGGRPVSLREPLLKCFRGWPIGPSPHRDPSFRQF